VSGGAGARRWLSDRALDRLREAAGRPDLSGTRYEALEVLGRGGMGTVYRAHDRALGLDVALKVVTLPEAAAADAAHGADTADAERLLAEARILARLEHPGLVPVHDAGTLADGRAFYAMKLVRGRRLDDYAAEAALPERLRVFERVCEAVAFAHAQGVGRCWCSTGEWRSCGRRRARWRRSRRCRRCQRCQRCQRWWR
jgi:serine/threonine protein kinase